MEAFDIVTPRNKPTAQSKNTYTVTRKTQEQMENAIRENHELLDQMEPWQYLGAFPFGYSPINTNK